jgi:O-antigen/teichoic acid export membrane protein
MIGEVVPKLIGLLVLPIMTAYLTPEDYGVIAYVDTIIIFIFNFSILSLNSYILREYFELDKQSKKKLVGNFFIFLVLCNVFLLFFYTAAFYLLFGVLELSFNFFPIMIIAFFANFFEVISLFPQLIFRVQERAKEYIIFTIGKTALQISCIVILLVYFNQDILSKYYGVLIINVMFAIISFKIIKRYAVFVFDLNQIKKGIKFSLPLLMGSLSLVLLNSSDVFILERYVSYGELGLYAVAYTFGFAINVIIVGSYKAYEPILFKSANHSSFLKIFYEIRKYYLILIFFTGFVVILFSQELLYYMANDEFYEAYYLVPIITIAAISKGIFSLYSVLLMVQKRTRDIGFIIILGAGVNIGINLLFVEEYGSIVAALSTLVAFLFMTLLVSVKSFSSYPLSLQNLLSEYMFIMILLVFSYFSFFYINFELSVYLSILKVFIAIFVLIAIIIFYKKDYSKVRFF